MIETICEHSVDTSLLFEGAKVLDIGARGFGFCKEMRARGCTVYPVDCDVLNEGQAYYRCAISAHDGRCGVERPTDKQATRIVDGDEIDMFSLESFSKMVGVKFWDLIKCDVESSEYEIIMALSRAPSKQLSIEFHLLSGIYGTSQMTEMENKLRALGYEFAQHEMSHQHHAGLNYWNSLFILTK